MTTLPCFRYQTVAHNSYECTFAEFLWCVLPCLEDVVSYESLDDVCVVLERSLVVGADHLLLVSRHLLRDAACRKMNRFRQNLKDGCKVPL